MRPRSVGGHPGWTLGLAAVLGLFDLAVWGSTGVGPRLFGVIMTVLVGLLLVSAIRQEGRRLSATRDDPARPGTPPDAEP